MKQCANGHGELTAVDVGITEIDECGECHGIWLDKDELREFKDATHPELQWLDFELWKHGEQYGSSHSPKPCPVCKKPMVGLNYGDSGIDLDYCPNCRGTWLEHGQFEKIIASLEQEVLTKSFNDYVRESVEEAREILTGPKSFREEWKDFATVLRLMQHRLFAENPKLLDALLAFNKTNPFR